MQLLRLGDRVAHPKFGEGEVVDLDTRPSADADGQLTWPVVVRFAGDGERALRSDVLERLGARPTRLAELADTILEYEARGRRAFQAVSAFARVLIGALDRHLDPRGGHVVGVPADGAWDPKKDWGDAMFGKANPDHPTLDPIRFALAVRVRHADTDTVWWIRTKLSAEITGELIRGRIENRFDFEHDPRDPDSLSRLCALIYKDLCAFYADAIHRHDGEGVAAPIGFDLMRA
ncbi:MAG: hypothetical protein ACFE0P_10640 [Oceanicaulis sp.]